MFSGGIDKQHRTVMGQKKFQRSSLLVSISKYVRNVTYGRKKRLTIPKNYAQPSVKLPNFRDLSSLGGRDK